MEHLSPEGAAALARNPNVLLIEHDRSNVPDSVRGLSNLDWGLDYMDQRIASGDYLFHWFYSGGGVRIYVVDAGVNPSVSELTGRVQTGMSVVGNRSGQCQSTDYPATVNVGDHGTVVASVAAGSNIGIARGSSIVPVRVITTGNALESDQIAGLNCILSNGVLPAVVNMSITMQTSAGRDAINNVINGGYVFVKSAGNDNVDACGQIGNTSNALIVAATDQTNARGSFSDFGSCITLWAPGVNVAGQHSDGTIGSVSGTSFSAPAVAGVAALILQQYPIGLGSNFEVKQVVRTSGTSIPTGPLGTGSPGILLYSTHTYAEHANVNSTFRSGDTPVTNTITSRVLGGDGSWSYLWEESLSGSGYWEVVGTGSSYSRTADACADYSIDVRLTATSNGDAVVTTRTYTYIPWTGSSCW